MIELAIGSLFAVVAVSGIRLWANLHRQRMTEMRAHQNKFFELGNQIISDEDTEDDVLHKLLVMASDMRRKRNFWNLLSVLAQLDREIREGAYTPPVLRHKRDVKFTMAKYHYLMSLTYLSILGFFARALLAKVLDPSEGEVRAEIINSRLHAGSFKYA